MKSNEQNPFAFHEIELNEEREKMRRNNKGECYTKEELIIIANQEYQVLNNITDVDERTIQDVGMHMQQYRDYYYFISNVFPYQLYFQILLNNPNETVKIHALKHLSDFSQYPSFPYDELIGSPCISLMLEVLSQSNLEITISPIINILTNLLKAHPDCRDSLMEENIVNIISEKLFSPKVPAFLETILTITPQLEPEQILFINQLYDRLLSQNLKFKMNVKQNITVINTIRSIIHLLELKYEPFDYSFVINYIKTLLKSDRRIICVTVRMIGYLPLPTIEFAQDCISIITKTGDLAIIHILLNVFIQKHGEWDHYEDMIIETCILVHEIEESTLNDNLLSLKALLLYFPFNQRYDDRIIDLMIQFISYPDINLQIINGLINMLENAEFEEGERESFFEKVNESIDEFQAVIESDEDEDVCRQVSYFLQEIEKVTQE